MQSGIAGFKIDYVTLHHTKSFQRLSHEQYFFMKFHIGRELFMKAAVGFACLDGVIKRTLGQGTHIGNSDGCLVFGLGGFLQSLIALKGLHRLNMVSRRQRAEATLQESVIGLIFSNTGAVFFGQIEGQFRHGAIVTTRRHFLHHRCGATCLEQA